MPCWSSVFQQLLKVQISPSSTDSVQIQLPSIPLISSLDPVKSTFPPLSKLVCSHPQPISVLTTSSKDSILQQDHFLYMVQSFSLEELTLGFPPSFKPTIEITYGSIKQKQYGDTFGTMLKPATKQIVGTVHRFFECQESLELLYQTTNSQLTSKNETSTQCKGVQLLSPTLRLQTKSTLRSTVVRQFNIVHCILAEYVADS